MEKREEMRKEIEKIKIDKKRLHTVADAKICSQFPSCGHLQELFF